MQMMPNETDSCFEQCAGGSNHSADDIVEQVHIMTAGIPGYLI